MNETELDFQKIHADFRPGVQRYLARLVGEFEAEDLTQEVFVKISQALHTFRGESKLSTWIYRIAANTAMDRIRSPSFDRIGSNDFSGCSDSCETEIMDRDAPSVEQQLFHKERAACYQDCIETLPENYRKVVVLSELEKLAADEIADVLGLSVEAVKMRMHRGRSQLLQVLKSHCKAEDWL